MEFRRTRGRSIEINIAPLVDVVFLLVIFFAVSTTFLETAGLELELPSSSSTAQRESKLLMVVLGADGQMAFDDEVLDAAALREKLRAALEATDKKMVVLRADTHTEHGEVVKAMDLIREAGAAGIRVDAKAAPAE
jgi:biopolymer transport protein ExbD